ncbi:MAG: endonuclease/exonuclease/phosphatase family protein [Bacteroidota bacterium]
MRLLSFIFLVFVFSGELLAQAPLNVMSFNIRYNNITDEENSWPFRKDNAAMQIRFYEANVVGVQEALHDQLEDLKQRLPGFNVIGVGRDDGKQAGEYSAILYNKDRLKVLDSATFWLSETPDKPGSKGWDAAITRVVTWAKFRDKKTRKAFYLFNTHFDHKGSVARRESARLLLKAVDSIAGKMPAIITGDFNAAPLDEPIKVLTDITNKFHLTNTLGLSQLPHYGPAGTFNEFGPKEISNNPIDYIFIKGKFHVLKHATISESWGGRFSSDHFPVFTSLVIL